MNSPTGSIADNVVVIDSDDDDDDDDDDGDQKPAAKPPLSRAAQKSESAQKKDKCIISLLDSDEENESTGTTSIRSRDQGGMNRIHRDKTITIANAATRKITTPSKQINSPSRRKKRNMDDEDADRELAFQLQCAEDNTSKSKNSPSRWKKRHREEEDADRMLAEKMQRAESKASKSSSHHSASADRKLAQELQRMEDEASRKASPTKERNLMAKSTDGKAVLAVQEIIALVRTTKEQFIDTNPALKGGIEAVTIDDMVFMAKNMLEKQKEFIDNQIPGDIGKCLSGIWFH
jgi:hypothetical protein